MGKFAPLGDAPHPARRWPHSKLLYRCSAIISRRHMALLAAQQATAPVLRFIYRGETLRNGRVWYQAEARDVREGYDEALWYDPDEGIWLLAKLSHAGKSLAALADDDFDAACAGFCIGDGVLGVPESIDAGALWYEAMDYYAEIEEDPEEYESLAATRIVLLTDSQLSSNAGARKAQAAEAKAAETARLKEETAKAEAVAEAGEGRASGGGAPSVSGTSRRSRGGGRPDAKLYTEFLIAACRCGRPDAARRCSSNRASSVSSQALGSAGSPVPRRPSSRK